MPDSKVYRFGVRDSSGNHSMPWRIWTQGNDCYLGARHISNSYKASFHESGQCQVGISGNLRKNLEGDPGWENQSRLYDIWYIDRNLTPGSSTELIEVIIPCSHLDKFKLKKTTDINWIDCSDNSLISVGVFLANIRSDRIIHSTQEQLEALTKLPLQCGLSMLVLKRLLSENCINLGALCQMLKISIESPSKKRTYKNGNLDHADKSIRGMIWQKQENRRSWYELSYVKSMQDG